MSDVCEHEWENEEGERAMCPNCLQAELARLRKRLEAAEGLISAEDDWLAGKDCQTDAGIKRALARRAAARAAYDEACKDEG